MKLLVVVVLSVVVVGAQAERVRYDFHKVHRLLPKNERHLNALRELLHNNEYNFWVEPGRVNKPVDVMVPPHKSTEFSEFVKGHQIEERVTVEDVQELIDEEQATLKTRSLTMDWTDYHTLEEFEDWMVNLTKTYNNVKMIVAGKSYEKRDIKGIEITFRPNFRTVFIESNIHAREWIAAAATSWVVNEILKSPKGSIWRKFNYIYIPFFNPDGYAYSWTSDRMWRKTRTPYKYGSITCYGADPNRNWDFQWNEVGASNDPCSEIYAGPKAFSEMETKTLSDFLSKNAVPKKIDVYLGFHSFSQIIMYPWDWTPDCTPLTETWDRIGKAAAEDLKAVNGEEFEVGNGFHHPYPASGTSMDWYYANYNSTITFVYELRDKGVYGFLLPPKFILPSAKELYASVERIMKEYKKLPPKTY